MSTRHLLLWLTLFPCSLAFGASYHPRRIADSKATYLIPSDPSVRGDGKTDDTPSYLTDESEEKTYSVTSGRMDRPPTQSSSPSRVGQESRSMQRVMSISPPGKCSYTALQAP
jgi:hypothetical protein